MLSLSHPIGRFKARVFIKLGYSREKWTQLEKDIRKFILPLEPEKVEDTEYGKKFVITGSIKTPSGKVKRFKTVWIIKKGERNPRFITIYPEGK